MQDDESAVSHTRLAYLPALDGMRACAVLAVMMFHGGIPHMDGGFMGVDAFFVLSGFLITSLLIGEWRQALTIKLGAFWARRARRLLPALLLMLLFVAFFASVIVPKGTYGALRLDALATLLYVSNWHFILVNSNYFNETSASSPLLHTWSLAVEEQFYVIWPLVVLAVLHFTRSLRALFALCCAAAIASAIWMYHVYDGGLNTNRAYLGTDTRSQCLFIGCALAVGLVLVTQRHHEEGRLAKGELWRPESSDRAAALRRAGRGRGRRRHRPVGARPPRRRRSRTRAGSSSSGCRWPASSWRPSARRAAWCRGCCRGRRSATWAGFPTGSTSGTGPSSSGSITPGPGLSGYELFAVRVLVTFAVSVVSFHLVERPIRMGTFVSQWRAWLAVPAGVGAVLVAVVAATTGTSAVASTALPAGTRTTGSSSRPRPARRRPPPSRRPAGEGPPLRRLGGPHPGPGPGRANVQDKYDYQLADKGILGCGVVDGPRSSSWAGTTRHGVRRTGRRAGRRPSERALAAPVAAAISQTSQRGRPAGRALGGGRPRSTTGRGRTFCIRRSPPT